MTSHKKGGLKLNDRGFFFFLQFQYTNKQLKAKLV